jgi:hypothetical protein
MYTDVGISVESFMPVCFLAEAKQRKNKGSCCNFFFNTVNCTTVVLEQAFLRQWLAIENLF